MKIDTLLKKLSNLFPESLQESFDNTGSQLVFENNDLSNILISLDINSHTIEKAKEHGCNLIITHHPLIFRPLKEIRKTHYRQGLIFELIQNNVSLYSIHTNLDKHYWNRLAEALGLENIRPLFPETSNAELGIGSYGTLPEPETLEELLKHIKQNLHTQYLLHSKDSGKKLFNIATLNGAGGSSIYTLLESGLYDCIITGDVTYHLAYEAAEAGVVLIDAGHFHTEKLFCNFLQSDIKECLTEENSTHQIFINSDEINPLYLYK